MTWPNFQFQQADLESRCAIPPDDPREYCEVNLLYGAARLIREYAGLPLHEPLPWAVQHLINFKEDRIPPSVLRSNLPHLLTITADEHAGQQAKNLNVSRVPARAKTGDKEAESLADLGFTHHAPIGTPFLYAREVYRMRNLEDDSMERRGTIVFPDKSDYGKEVDYDRDGWVKFLVDLPEEYQPVYVGIFWRDYLRGVHEPFARAGLPLVTAGHSNDPDFYLRLYDICRRFKYACSNEISTSFCLSVISGCKFFFKSTGAQTVARGGVVETFAEEPSLDRPGKARCLEVSPFPPVEDDGGKQRELAELYSGVKFLRPPEFFRELWEPGREALSRGMTTAALDFTAEPRPPRPDFARWLPHGFDPDGVGDDRCGLEFGSLAGQAGVEMLIRVSKTPENPKQTLTVILGGDTSQVHEYKAVEGLITIRIRQRRDAQRRTASFLAGAPKAARDKPKRKAIRLLKISWCESFADSDMVLG